MERFRPDSWLEGLLRPLVLMEPKAGIYFEQEAPDWRFAFILLFVAIAWLAGRRSPRTSLASTQLLAATFVVLYLWTGYIGNGRYFLGGLILAGPLLVMTWRALPGTLAFRWFVLLGVTLLQLGVVAMSYSPNRWGLVRWSQGAAVDLADSPVRHQPAVFITTSSISYSILVPKFHPESRWTNVTGQRDLTPAMREYKPLVTLLSGPLPKYAVLPIAAKFADAQAQPMAEVRQVYDELLAPYGLVVADQPCHVLRSSIGFGPPDASTSSETPRGFWVCALNYDDARRRSARRAAIFSPRVAAAVSRIETACPRFFPPGSGNDRNVDQLLTRHYPTDVAVFVDVDESVYLKHFRALNPTRIGSVDQVLQGRFELPCEKLPGRYRLPWQAD